MYFLLEYDFVDDYLERRPAFRARHFEVARPFIERGELRLAGALDAPTERAVLVFQGDDRTVAESFARADPYVQNGLVRAWRVRGWSVVLGADFHP